MSVSRELYTFGNLRRAAAQFSELTALQSCLINAEPKRTFKFVEMLQALDSQTALRRETTRRTTVELINLGLFEGLKDSREWKLQALGNNDLRELMLAVGGQLLSFSLKRDYLNLASYFTSGFQKLEEGRSNILRARILKHVDERRRESESISITAPQIAHEEGVEPRTICYLLNFWKNRGVLGYEPFSLGYQSLDGKEPLGYNRLSNKGAPGVYTILEAVRFLDHQYPQSYHPFTKILETIQKLNPGMTIDKWRVASLLDYGVKYSLLSKYQREGLTFSGYQARDLSQLVRIIDGSIRPDPDYLNKGVREAKAILASEEATRKLVKKSKGQRSLLPEEVFVGGSDIEIIQSFLEYDWIAELMIRKSEADYGKIGFIGASKDREELKSIVVQKDETLVSFMALAWESLLPIIHYRYYPRSNSESRFAREVVLIKGPELNQALKDQEHPVRNLELVRHVVVVYLSRGYRGSSYRSRQQLYQLVDQAFSN